MANKNKEETQNLLKKYWFIGLVAIILLVFIGMYAKDAYDNRPVYVKTKQVDGKDVLISINDQNFFADDLFGILNVSTGNSVKLEQFTNFVLAKAYKDTDEMKNFATNVVANYAQASKTDLETVFRGMSEMGYEPSLDGLKEYCMAYQKKIKMSNEYYNDHLSEYKDNIFTSLKPMVVSHILVKAGTTANTDQDGNTTYQANPTDEEAKKLQDVLDALAAGTPFEEVAKQYSDDGSAVNGGYLGLYDMTMLTNTMVEAFAKGAIATEYDTVSEPVVSEYGYHIIKVDTPTDEQFQEMLNNGDFLSSLNTLYPKAYLTKLMELANGVGAVINDEDMNSYITSVLESED